MSRSKTTKEPHETIAMSVFAGKSIAERLFSSMDPDELFDEIETQIKNPLEKHGLSTADPEKLYHQERPDHLQEWPEHIHAAVDAFYAFHQARRCMKGNDAKWTAYHMISAIKHISLYNLLAFDDKISLGDKLIVAQSEGGRASAQTRRELANANKAIILEDAQKLLADGHAHRELVGILCIRYGDKKGFRKSTIRSVLNKEGTLAR